MDRPKLLIVDDEETVLSQMRWALATDYDVLSAGDRGSALQLFNTHRPPLVALDLGLPPSPHEAVEGLTLLKEILLQSPRTKILIISGNAEKVNALKAIDEGAYDFFSKPINLDELATLLRRAVQLYRIEEENAARRRNEAIQQFGEMIGQNQQMREIFAIIRKVADTNAPVLILGESGTGKELIAKAIHDQGFRRDHPWIVINCGAIPSELLESELFGHERGAFTGAHLQRKGKIEFAQGGTLFLDEIGDLPLSLQVKLLRFLQEFRVERIGGRQSIPVNVRIVAATHCDIQSALSEGRFRDDLYYRLSVVTISVPPLCERKEDIPLLADAFLQRFQREYRKRIKGFADEAYRAMQLYSWPGNIRELENKIKRAIILAEGPYLTVNDLELPFPVCENTTPSLKIIRQQAERELVIAILSRHKWNISRAAAELGISRATLYERIERFKIAR